MKKIVFLILHYITLDDTIKSVDSIKKVDYKNYEIVLVDNGSPNRTGVELKKMYEKDKKVHVLLTGNNLGFANGNNYGFKYIKDNLNPDLIVMMNNDVIITENDFCKKIVDEYEYSKFALLGPKIILPGDRVSDFSEEILSLKDYKKLVISKKIHYFFNKIYLRFIFSFFDKIINALKNKNVYNKNIRKEDCLVNGCCLIFSKEYIDKFDGINDRTFLYYEEQLLYLRIRKAKMKIVYNPDIVIFHNESSSTKRTLKEKRKRFDFILKNQIQSLNVLIDEMSKEL